MNYLSRDTLRVVYITVVRDEKNFPMRKLRILFPTFPSPFSFFLFFFFFFSPPQRSLARCLLSFCRLISCFSAGDRLARRRRKSSRRCIDKSVLRSRLFSFLAPLSPLHSSLDSSALKANTTTVPVSLPMTDTCMYYTPTIDVAFFSDQLRWISFQRENACISFLQIRMAIRMPNLLCSREPGSINETSFAELKRCRITDKE